MERSTSPEEFLAGKIDDLAERIEDREDRVRELKTLIEEELESRRKLIGELRTARSWYFELTGVESAVPEPHELVPDVSEHTKQHHMVSQNSVRQRVQDYAMQIPGQPFAPKQAYEYLKERYPETSQTTLYNSLPRLLKKNVLVKLPDGRYQLHPLLASQTAQQGVQEPSISEQGSFSIDTAASAA